MSNTPSIGIKLFIGFGTVLICTTIAITVQALRITKKQPEFIALGKLVAGLKVNPDGKDSSMSLPKEFIPTQIEIIESGELRRHAFERMRGEHPELKEMDVEIRATQSKGSNIINVAAIGAEPKFTRVFLDSILVEFIAFRRELVDNNISSVMNRIIEQVLAREKSVREKADAFNEFGKSYDLRLLEIEHERLAQMVSSLRGEIEGLRRLDPNSSKVKETHALLADSEKFLVEATAQHMRSMELKQVYESSNNDYQDWKRQLDRLDGGATQDDVAIMERPNVAVEDEPDLVLPLMMATAVGAVFGVVLAAIIISLMRKPSSSLPPPPLPTA